VAKTGKLKLGIVGACGRGASFKAACDANPDVKIQAVCDSNVEGLDAARQRLGAEEQYADYQQMLEKSQLDGVIIGTPMPLHVPQSIAALKRNLHVLCEVPAGVSVDECRELTLAAHTSSGLYMMAENYTYMKSNVLIREMVRRGLFGTTYFGEAEYIHELKGLNEVTKWRRKWQTGINGNTYPTHSLGPLLQWMPGDRVASVCCAGSGHHYKDPRGEDYQQEDSVLSLNRMAHGGLVKLRIDMLSDRPHAMTNYQVQGTDGCYESSRTWGDRNRVWLRSRSKDMNTWTDLSEFEAEFLPEMWKQASETARKAGHGGGDYFEVMDFVDACMGHRPVEIGIDLAMDMTLPGLASQTSAAQGGRWVEVPDSRRWVDESSRPKAQLRMRLGAKALASPPECRLAEGYRLRTLEEADWPRYTQLMDKAGFGGWDPSRIRSSTARALPGSFTLIEHVASGTLAATAFANHSASEHLPGAASLEFVAGDPDHKGKGLGYAVCAHVTELMVQRGYKTIFLTTDDWRLPAIAVYLKLGYEPDSYMDDMPGRWDAVMKQLVR
jgi:predicted dehydrogenase/GNAT superfamily N-acetyltransferase